jgi:multiple sugar transport system ATP-binding protein
MKDGYIMQIGTSQDVFNRPANKFVAGFIGTPQMNFFDAELALSGGNYVVRVSGIELMLSSDKQKILQQKKQEPCKMILGIRPEHINVVTADTPNAIKAKVDVSEMMGSEIYLHVVVGEKDVVIRVQIADMMPQAFEPGKSNYIHFEIPESMVHLFDAESENNLLY